MNESILDSIKKLLGIEADYTVFDTDIIIHINSTFMVLTQLGVGTGNFKITDNSKTWNDFIPAGMNFESVKTYVYQRVRLNFDPPTSSAAVEQLNRSISELEWRLLVEAETPTT